ncbi:hypothetical protein [Cellulomonas sp. S1-8]|nr:hypothetical protein [Cellulomonas sp. S1-8]UZN03312.1 hypothetical protein OKX07_20055 [Cellulomonas sp. S1-8]
MTISKAAAFGDERAEQARPSHQPVSTHHRDPDVLSAVDGLLQAG